MYVDCNKFHCWSEKIEKVGTQCSKGIIKDNGRSFDSNGCSIIHYEEYDSKSAKEIRHSAKWKVIRSLTFKVGNITKIVSVNYAVCVVILFQQIHKKILHSKSLKYHSFFLIYYKILPHQPLVNHSIVQRNVFK
jgi:hypothetical protein